MISFIIPAYNEERVIGRNLSKIKSFAKDLEESFEIIVVCDGNDKTASKARKAGVKVLEFEKRLGKGRAVVKGFEKSEGDKIVLIDADLSSPLTEVKKLISGLKDSDVVIGSRFKKGARIQTSVKRLIASRGFNALVNVLTRLGLKDTQSGFKAFKRKAFASALPLMISGFCFDVELLLKIKNKGFKIKEVPVKWVYDNNSKVTYSKAVGMLRDLFHVVNNK